MNTLVALAIASATMGAPSTCPPYFADDFDAARLAALPAKSIHGYGWRKVIDFDDAACQIVARPGGEGRCMLMAAKGAKPAVLDARLRLPERAEVSGEFDIRFDKDAPGYLAVTFCEGNYARLARLIFDHAAKADAVAVSLEQGAKGRRVSQVATLTPGQWSRATWANNVRRNTVRLAIDGKAVVEWRQVEPTDRFRRAAFSRLRFHAGKTGRVWLDNVAVIDPDMGNEAQAKPDFAAEAKEAIMCVDFFDLCFFASQLERRLYTPQDIEKLMAACKAAGFSSALWRVSACGSAVYRSQVEDRGFRSDRRPDAHATEEFLERWDPLAEACRIGHRAGIPIVVWMTVYDEGLPALGHYSKLLREHPEYQWVDRTGKCYFTGVPCYAFPEARRFRVRMIEEVCRYPVDGVMLSFRTHSVAHPEYKTVDEFGYEAPVVEEFKRRYGVDIRTQPFDRAAWHKLKGEYFTQLLRDVRAAIGPWRSIGVLILDWTEGPTHKTQHALDVRTWLKEKLVDAIYVQGGAKSVPSDFAAKYAFVRDAGAKLYCFRGVPDEEATFGNVSKLVAPVKGTPFSGIALMEAYKFQILRGRKRR